MYICTALFSDKRGGKNKKKNERIYNKFDSLKYNNIKTDEESI